MRACREECGCQTQPPVGPRPSLCCGGEVEPLVADYWRLGSRSFQLCLVYAWLCASAWVNLQFAVTSCKIKLLSRILNKKRMQRHCRLSKNKFANIFSLPLWFGHLLLKQAGRKIMWDEGLKCCCSWEAEYCFACFFVCFFVLQHERENGK